MLKLPRAIRELTETFEKLPGIGPKSAQRLVFYLLHYPEARLEEFAKRLTGLKKGTVICSICHNVSEQDPCEICSDQDVLALERSNSYQGLYHVLHGAIAPLNNIGPEQLFLHDIAKRLADVKELIIATNPTMEGEATALYISEYLQLAKNVDMSDVRVTRIGHGLPIGADIEYADGVTLKRALEGRRSI
jgi:recombination protein RecR